MSTALRRTGVNVLGDMPWGSHVCMFYESKEDLLDTVGPYFKAGLESKEFCLWAPPQPLTPEEAGTALSRRIPDFDRHLAAGKMEIVPWREWFFRGSEFGRKRIINAWDDKLRGALAKGYEGVRASGNPFSSDSGHWKDLYEYERALEKWIKGKRVIVLCTYPIIVSEAAEALQVARVHQLAIARRKGDWDLVEPAPAAARTHSLTPREREVLWWAAQGKSAWEIGEILHIAKRTVDEHTQKATSKLGAVNRTQAVAIALRERLIGKDPP
jgi:DNA-binding CsgD family transcriptional regulator